MQAEQMVKKNSRNVSLAGNISTLFTLENGSIWNFNKEQILPEPSRE